MRNRRAIVYDDEKTIRMVLRMFFEERGYEVITSHEPNVCPAHDERFPCSGHRACADIIISDFRMPGLTGAQRFQLQSERRCPIPFANKAIMSGDILDRRLADLRRSGMFMIEKPIIFDTLAAWLSDREPCMDLSSPLAAVRRETRSGNSANMTYVISTGNEDFHGVAINTSTCGLCMQTTAPLTENSLVKVRPLVEPSTKPAQVRWVRDSEAGSYMAGLRFTGCF
jgi:CheY-like chemotaxis protein